MTTPQRERDDEITAVSNMECILCDGCRVSTAGSVATIVGNLPNAPSSLEAVLHEVATLIPRAESEDPFKAIEDGRGSGERLNSRI